MGAWEKGKDYTRLYFKATSPIFIKDKSPLSLSPSHYSLYSPLKSNPYAPSCQRYINYPVHSFRFSPLWSPIFPRKLRTCTGGKVVTSSAAEEGEAVPRFCGAWPNEEDFSSNKQLRYLPRSTLSADLLQSVLTAVTQSQVC